MSPLAPKPQRMLPLEPAVVAFGSNLGDREATIRAAIDDLASTPGVRLDAVSPFHETAALRLDGVDEDAPRYLNGVALISTALDPHALLDELHRIEDANGRVRVERWGNRTLDLDLIAMGGRYIDDDTLVLPHPRAAEREFVLAPWLDVDPDAELPGLGRVDELLRRVRASAAADAGAGADAGVGAGADSAIGARAATEAEGAESDGSSEGARS
ncbi:2-amino-4-hydroxy-6-hydroxymethyldihydropteridine diphosphokinase [Rathayibacter sp. CAU 1779]